MDAKPGNGYQSLIEAVQHDCNKGECCFNPSGCNKENSKCFHQYCEKFKWTIDRAKHYSEKLNIPWEEILEGWEKERTYWYMNYYQDYNQPLLEGDRVKVFDTVDEMLNSIGKNEFRCPCCDGISTSPYKCDSGIIQSNKKACDWKVYGLLGDLGKGVFVYCKDKVKGERWFMPVAWEKAKELAT